MKWFLYIIIVGIIIGGTNFALMQSANFALAQSNDNQPIFDTVFVPGTEDVPLMEGLQPIEGGMMQFDSPSGRIVESLAYAEFSMDVIRKFYSETLPALGWTQSKQTYYIRNEERLVLELWVEQGFSMVRFRLTPK